MGFNSAFKRSHVSECLPCPVFNVTLHLVRVWQGSRNVELVLRCLICNLGIANIISLRAQILCLRIEWRCQYTKLNTVEWCESTVAYATKNDATTNECYNEQSFSIDSGCYNEQSFSIDSGCYNEQSFSIDSGCYKEECYNEQLLSIKSRYYNEQSFSIDSGCYNERMLQRAVFFNRLRMLQRTAFINKITMLQRAVFFNRLRMLQRTNATTTSLFQ